MPADLKPTTLFSAPSVADGNRAIAELRPRERKIAVVLNSSLALNFVRGQLEYLQRQGFAVTVFCPPRRNDEWEVARPIGPTMIDLPVERDIAPLQDLGSLWRLLRAMHSLRPAVTNVGTPKAGLLGGLAAWLTRVPCRFYTLHGLRFETTRGLKRMVLILLERLACRLAHRVVCVSPSVREKAIASGLAPAERCLVFGSGSCNGIDASRFAPQPELVEQGGRLRQRLGIPLGATVLIFVGRLTCDKGIPELIEAFTALDQRFPNLRLLLVGTFEKEDPLPAATQARLYNNPHIIFAGPVRDVPPYYSAADIVVIPSHREGLPTVVLEAQASGKAVVGASATGIVDVVADGETGLLFPVGNAPALAEALTRLITNPVLAQKLETAGLEQIKRHFAQEPIWRQLFQSYLEVLRANSREAVPASNALRRKALVPVSPKS